MAHEGTTPFFDHLIDGGSLERNLFAFFLTSNPKQEESELTFGYYDASKFIPETLNWHKVTNKVFFAVELVDVRIGNTSLNLCGDKSPLKNKCTVAPDSGTGELTMPSWAIK